MRVVILLDRSFARREHDLLSRLEIGLVDEGVRVIHAVPRAILASEVGDLYSTAVGYDDRGFPTTPGSRVRELHAEIQEIVEDETDPHVDLVHSFGASTAKLAVALAHELKAAPIIEAWSRGGFGDVAHAAAGGAFSRTGGAVLFGDEALRAAFEASHPATGPRRLIVAPWGVHASGGDVATRTTKAASAAAMLIEGTHMPLLKAAMAGLSQAAAAHPELLVFLDSERAKADACWKLGRELNLLDRISMVPGMEARRSPVLRLDALLVPEPAGKLRTLVLDAMAHGVPVAAAVDPSISFLSGRVEGVARLVEGGTAAGWAAAIGDVLDPARRERQVDAAREYVRTQRPASAHVAGVLRTYEAAVHAAHPAGGAPPTRS